MISISAMVLILPGIILSAANTFLSFGAAADRKESMDETYWSLFRAFVSILGLLGWIVAAVLYAQKGI